MVLMKRILIFVTLILVCFTNGFGQSDGPPPKQPIESFSALKNYFPDPPAAYRSAPLWVWNDRVTKEKIDRQLRQFKKEGMGGVFVHPRPGLITPYLSEEWNNLFRYTVNQGKKLGMKVWIYDENSYPSGFAGGHVPAEMPESVNQGQGLTLYKNSSLPDSVDKFHLVLKKTTDGFREISGEIDKEKGEESSNYYLFKKNFYPEAPWYGGFSYVDLLMDGVTQKFIDVTMQGYEQKIGEEFGQVVPGIFTDEPNIKAPTGQKTIRWTPGLFEAFRQQWGYSLSENLPALFEETGNWKKVRHDYYSLLLDLFIKNWSKPWNEYTREQDLKWTGHYWEHGWPDPGHGGDNMAMYAWHQVPGIDILFNNYQEDVNAQFGNVRAVKELSSIANQMGRDRALSETYGGGGWNLTFQDMKRIGDWEYVLGVNFLNQHLSSMTIKGARKRDYPQSFSYHEPWWDHYDLLGDYFGRLSLALSAGKQINNTLVIEPTSTTWMYFSASGENKSVQQRGENFQDFLVELEAEQVEYDLGSERIIREFGQVKRNDFVIGERGYELVVLPPGLQNLDTHTADLIEEFLANGGRVLSFVSPPSFISGEASSRMENVSAKYSNLWQQASTSKLAHIPELKSKHFQINRFKADSGKLFHRRMQLENGQVLFLVNTSEKHSSSGTITMKGNTVNQLDLVSGDITPYPWEDVNNGVTFSYDLPPTGSLLLHINNETVSQAPSDQDVLAHGKPTTLQAQNPLEIRREKPNTLTLDYSELTIDGKKMDNQYFFRAANEVFKHHGFDSNPWSRAVQYKRNILKKNDFEESSGFQATYTFSVKQLGDVGKEGLRAVIERPRLWEISVNGHAVEPMPGEWWIDRAFGKYDIGEYVRQGENHITINATKMTVFSELEPIYILGDFALESFDQGWRIVPDDSLELGGWSSQGMPFYGDKVSYSKTYSLTPEEDDGYIIRLNEWKGTAATVHVNGEKAGTIGWPPYELDITGSLQKGKNNITVNIIGSLKNTLGPHHNNPDRWIASPWMFREAPKTQPAGMEYDVIGYGLMKDFELVRKELQK